MSVKVYHFTICATIQRNYFKIYFIIPSTFIYLCMAKKSKVGRKKLPDAEKTILVGFYTKQENVNKVGGLQKAREKAKQYIEELGCFTTATIEV